MRRNLRRAAWAFFALSTGPAWSDSKTTKTGVADFELVEQNSKFTLHDDAYDVTFPTKPTVSGTTSTNPTWVAGAVLTVNADAELGDDQFLSLSFVLPPFDAPVNVERAMKDGRDAVIKKTNGKLVSEKSEAFGGLSGRTVVVSATFHDMPLYIELHMTYDAGHRAMILAMLMNKGSAQTDAGKAFVASFKVNPKGKATPR